MSKNKKYEQWRAVTESDFVTLFIKTWFTFIALLRELNPEICVFTEDGKPRGDKPFLNAYKEEIMPIVQKKILPEQIQQELTKMYPISMKKILEVFPQYFFQTFYRINENFKSNEREIITDKHGKFKERYEAKVHIEQRYVIKYYIGVSGIYRTKNYNENIKKEIDLRPIISQVVNSHRMKKQGMSEVDFLHDIYDLVLKRMTETIEDYIINILPSKGYSSSINKKIESSCRRFINTMRIKYGNNYKLPHEIELQVGINEYAVVYQIPFNGFIKSYEDGYFDNKDYKIEYTRKVTNQGIEWFANYVYALRNALFHEIISPLDEEWQLIFKSAYLILKEITDICIDYIDGIDSFVHNFSNPFLLYLKDNKILLLDDPEKIKKTKISFKNLDNITWTFDKGIVTLKGTLKSLLCFENGESKECENIFYVSLDEAMNLVRDESGNVKISIEKV